MTGVGDARHRLRWFVGFVLTIGAAVALKGAAVPLVLNRRPFPFDLGLAMTRAVLGALPLPLPAGPGFAGLPQIDDIAQGVTLRFRGARRCRHVCTRAGQAIAYPNRGCGVLRRVLLADRGMAKQQANVHC